MGEDRDGGPGENYKIFNVMSDLLDKLKLLNFEELFIQANKMKPVSRHYFAIPTNPGEQFHTFTSLCAWLISITDRSFDPPQEYDDPNVTITRILKEARSMDIDTDFPPSKLKSGSGPNVCVLLDKLAENALVKTKFAWGKPLYETEIDEEEVMQQEDDSEVKLDNIEDDLVAAEDSDEEIFLDLKSTEQADKEVLKQKEIMVSNTSSEEWKLEIERVTPLLKVTVKTDNRDWRAHQAQMSKHKSGIEANFVESKQQLGRIQAEIQKTLEKIGSREKYINGQLETLVGEMRSAQERLNETKEKYGEGSSGVTERSRMLGEVSEEVERVKMEMEEKGSSMTDGTILVKVKQTLGRLKKECTEMNVRIGVIEHVLRQDHLKHRDFSLQQEVN